jgi:TetR/AcrR family transcriptional regulator of autoinduction and epiphytic fitness
MGVSNTDGATARGYRSPRRETQARQTRARIIAAAGRRFLAHGYSGTTMRAVALDAGVALPTVELAFRTKARLLKAVIDVAIAGDDEHAAMLERGWATRAQFIAEPADFVAAFARVLTDSAERAAGLAAAALEGARADEDIAAVAAQLMSQRQVMAAWLVDGIMLRSSLRDETSRTDAVDTVWTLMDPVIFRRLTEDRRWPPSRFERWFTDSVTQLLLPAAR